MVVLVPRHKNARFECLIGAQASEDAPVETGVAAQGAAQGHKDAERPPAAAAVCTVVVDTWGVQTLRGCVVVVDG